MRKKWSREAFEKKFGSVEWSQNKNTPEAKEYERMSSQYSTYMLSLIHISEPTRPY